MHPHGNPNRHLGETGRRNAALRIRTDSFDAVTIRQATARKPAVTKIQRRTEFGFNSASLFASCASSAEISAVRAGVPQLGASLPSPHARGR